MKLLEDTTDMLTVVDVRREACNTRAGCSNAAPA